VYSQAEAHLANLDLCGGRNLRRAYLILLIAAERAGLHALAREGAAEMVMRDAKGRQPYVVSVAIDQIEFSLRQPAIEAAPELRGEVAVRFAGRIAYAGESEMRIRIQNDRDAEDVVAWLFTAADVSLGYAARRSA
jgi:hypothetical protein